MQTISFQGAGATPGMRLGDVDGDGRLDIVMGQCYPQSRFDAHTPQEVARVTAFSVVTGDMLWQYTPPGNPDLSGHSASSDIPIQVYDWDGDGAAEVIAAFSNEEFTFLDGRTGKVMRTIPIPQGQSARGSSGSNDCIIIANLRGTRWPQDFIVKTRYTQVWGIDGRDGSVLWGPYGKRGNADNLAHYGYVYDVDEDGWDEYLSGWQLHSPSGEVLWSVSGLRLHLDAAAIGDIDGNPANGKEFILGSNIGVAVNARSGEVLWRDTVSGTVEIQQMGVGDFRPDLQGLETVVLDRIGPRDNTGVDANVLLSSAGSLLWRETPFRGWLTVTERLSNWNGEGRDYIFSYRRTSVPPTLYDGEGREVAAFAHPGSYNDYGMHANLCGDEKEEVVIYNASTAWIYANGGCDLRAPMPAQPQNRRHYNWSLYTGWEDKDHTFFTPGLSPVVEANDPIPGFSIHRNRGSVIFKRLKPSVRLKIRDTRGKLLAEPGLTKTGEWTWETGSKPGVYLVQATDGVRHEYRKIVLH